MQKLVRWHPNERVDLTDQDNLMGFILENLLRENRIVWLPEGRGAGVPNTEMRIFNGFRIQNIVGLVCEITRGSGILKIRWQGDTLLGIVMGEIGDDAKQIDLTAEADGDYAVYIRVTRIDATAQNRVFWNAVGATEQVQNVLTTQDLTWEYVIQAWAAAPPSRGDYLRVAKITKAVGALTYYDYRHLFFEGDCVVGAGQYADEWGSGTDRNADRATYGVNDLHKWVQAMRAQLKQITGIAWYTASDPDLNDLAAEHAVDGKHEVINTQGIVLNSRDGLPTDSTWTFSSDEPGGAGEHQCRITAPDIGTFNIFRMDAGAGYNRFGLNPRGNNAALVNNDYGEYVTLGPDNAAHRWGMQTTNLNVALRTCFHRFGQLDTGGEMLLSANTIISDGLFLTAAGARYYVASRTEDILVVPSEIIIPAGSNWCGIMGTIPTTGWGISFGHALDPICFIFTDWPEGMVINSIKIGCELTGGPGVPATLMSFAAYMHNYDHTVGPPPVSTIIAIGVATKNTYTHTVETIVSGSGANWSHYTDRLYVNVTAPDDALLVEGRIYQFILNVTYSTVSKWTR